MVNKRVIIKITRPPEIENFRIPPPPTPEFRDFQETLSFSRPHKARRAFYLKWTIFTKINPSLLTP